MSTKFLGQNFDIHTGGVDLVFPHHENEIAQSEALSGGTMVNYWVHCEHLLVDGKKMSKSLGNFYTLRDVLDKGFKPIAIRYILMSTSFRQQLNFTFEGLKAAENAVERINDFMIKIREISEPTEHKGVDMLTDELKKGYVKNMDDNLNVSGALAELFEFIRKVNRLISENRVGVANAKRIIETVEGFDSVLGFLKTEEPVLDEEVEKMIADRELARKEKDFSKSDAIRDQLKDMGIILEDTDKGTRWKRA